MPAGVVGADDEAKFSGSRGKRLQGRMREADNHHHPAWRGAYAAGSGVACGFCHSFEYDRVSVAESEANAASEQPAAQRMRTDCLSPGRAARSARCDVGDQ